MAAPAAELAGPGVLGVGEYVVPPDSILYRIPNKTWRPEGREGVFDAMVPLDLIAQDAVPVSAGRVAGMQELLLRARGGDQGVGTGVYDSIMICEVPGRGLLRIADGFHRHAAVLGLNQSLDIRYDQPEIFCTLVPNCSEEKLLDLRIASASEHGEVSFARAALWILDFWKSTPWSKLNLTASHAFGLEANHSSGAGFGLDPEVARDIKQWASDKSSLWGTTAGNLCDELALASISAPDLVISVRTRESGRRLAALTRKHLEIIATAFSHIDIGEESATGQNWDIQRRIADYTLKNNLQVPRVRVLVGLLSGLKTVQAVEERLADINPSQLRSSNSGGSRSGARSGNAAGLAGDSIGLIAEINGLRTQAIVREVAFAVQGLALAMHKGRYIAPRIGLDNTQLFTVITGDNPELDKVLVERDNSHLEEMLAKRSSRIAALAASKNGYTLDESQTVVPIAIDRVVQSAVHGPARYVEVGGSSMVDNVLYAALMDELREMHEESAAGLSEYEEACLSGDPSEIMMDRIVSLYPSLSSSDMLLVARHGVLQLDALAIGGMTKNTIARVHRAMLSTHEKLIQSTAG